VQFESPSPFESGGSARRNPPRRHSPPCGAVCLDAGRSGTNDVWTTRVHRAGGLRVPFV
jgi:hypothetical protein